MKTIVTLLALTLLSCEGQAQRGIENTSREGRSPKVAGCSVKVNDQKVLSQSAIIGTPANIDTAQFKLVFLFQNGRLFEATLTDKQSGEILKLSNESNGTLNATVIADEAAGSPLNLSIPASSQETAGQTVSGDWAKLERDSKDNLPEGEIYFRSNEFPAAEINFSCHY
jgi:hypothetical protein